MNLVPNNYPPSSVVGVTLGYLSSMEERSFGEITGSIPVRYLIGGVKSLPNGYKRWRIHDEF